MSAATDLPGSVPVTNDGDEQPQRKVHEGGANSQGVEAKDVIDAYKFMPGGRALADLYDKGVRVDRLDVPAADTDETCCGCNAMDPESTPRYVWDIVLVLLLMYIAIAIPVRLAFDVTIETSSFQFLFETVVDGFFVIDIFFNFRTAIKLADDQTGLPLRVTNRRVIAKHYFKSWFIIDFVAVLPYSYVEMLIHSDGAKEGGTASFFKTLRLVRLAKLLRLRKLMPLLRRLDDKIDGLLSSTKLITTMASVMYITHLVGCMWYAVGGDQQETYLVDKNGTQITMSRVKIEGWVSGQGWDEQTTTFFKWLRAFYWAMTTLTTVGYGDISPATETEMLFGTMAELCGTMVFGLLVGTVGSILTERQRLETRHEGEICELKEFMRAKNLPLALQKKVKRYLGLLFKSDKSFDEKAVMDRLPPKLSFEMMTYLYGNKLLQVPIFSDMPEEILYNICEALLPYPAAKGEFIYRVGDIAREFFIINMGEVIVTECVDDGTMTEAEIYAADKEARVMQVNNIFGEDALDFRDHVELKRKQNAIAVADVQLSMLRVSQIEALSKQYPIVEKNVRRYRRRAKSFLRQSSMHFRGLGEEAEDSAAPSEVAGTAAGVGGGALAPELEDFMQRQSAAMEAVLGKLGALEARVDGLAAGARAGAQP